ncbi:MAG: hypothetical protein GY722_22555 [bacterium]|nr:hypothetical protein [bacterium]
MSRLTDRARQFYAPELLPGEELLSIRQATAAGTGTKVAYGGLIGVLAGWLYAINLDTGLLPPLVLGALTGGMVGYFIAGRAARRPEGPGTIHLLAVSTNQRLLTTARYSSRRHRILRQYPLADVTVTKKRYPIGQYHLVEVTTPDGRTTGLVVEGTLDLPVN